MIPGWFFLWFQVSLYPNWAPEARSETLRTPQKVPAWSVSWPHDPASDDDDDDCGGDDDLVDGDNHCWLLLPRDGKWWPQEIELSFPRPLHICLEEALPACWAPSHHCTMCSCSPWIFLKEPRYEYKISYIATIYWKLFLLFAATIPFTDHLSQFASQRYILPFLRC